MANFLLQLSLTMIYYSFNTKSKHLKLNRKFLRNFNNINKDDIINDVAKINWTMLQHMDSVDEMVNFFNREIYRVI